MEHIYAVAAFWLGLAVVSAVVAYHLRISMALVEICVGVAAAAVAAHLGKLDLPGANSEWLRFLAGAGAVLLTFLAGAELEPEVLKKKLNEVTVVGLVGFLAPFLGCAALARHVLGWDVRASLLCGVARILRLASKCAGVTHRTGRRFFGRLPPDRESPAAAGGSPLLPGSIPFPFRGRRG